MSNHLDQFTKLTIHDYEFLKGNEVYWATSGAALWTVYEWCRGNGYGDFGKPTERGKKVMEEYELEHRF